MKSFSKLTKEELCKTENTLPCCDRAEYAGIMLFGGSITQKEIKFVTENRDVLKHYADLGHRIGTKMTVKPVSDGSERYVASISDSDQIARLLIDLNLTHPTTGLIHYRIDEAIIKNDCCKRAFLRGAFLGSGTVIDPRKNYNMEIVTSHLKLSEDLKEMLFEVGFEFKSVVRKSKYVLYMRNSDEISDVLSFMSAYKAQMELLNIKIEKEINNNFNRASMGEIANYEKTIGASVKQIQAIELIDKKIGIENLPDDLREIAILRLENKSKSLSELGKLLNLSKSGVNHRIKKLMEFLK